MGYRSLRCDFLELLAVKPKSSIRGAGGLVFRLRDFVDVVKFTLEIPAATQRDFKRLPAFVSRRQPRLVIAVIARGAPP